MNILRLTKYLLLSMSFLAPGCHGAVKIEKIVIYYIQWDLDTFAPQTCDDLISSGFSVEINDRAKIQNIVDLVNSIELVKMSDDASINARICCIFYGRQGDIIKTISYGPASSMAIDGSVYEMNNELFELLLDSLPSQYRDHVY